MKAIILAKGNPKLLPNFTPKPMVPLLGKPVMEHLVEHLKVYGTRQIMVNASHRFVADSIKNYFGNGSQWGVEIGYSFEGALKDGEIDPEPLGSAGGIKRIQDFCEPGFIDDTFCVVSEGVVIDFDLDWVQRQHDRSNAVASIVVAEVPKERVSRYGVVLYDENYRITSYQVEPSVDEAKSTLANTGVYVFEPEIIDHIPIPPIPKVAKPGIWGAIESFFVDATVGASPEEAYDIPSELLPDLWSKGLSVNAIPVPYSQVNQDTGGL